jgi:hypothetical protein
LALANGLSVEKQRALAQLARTIRTKSCVGTAMKEKSFLNSFQYRLHLPAFHENPTAYVNYWHSRHINYSQTTASLIFMLNVQM